MQLRMATNRQAMIRMEATRRLGRNLCHVGERKNRQRQRNWKTHRNPKLLFPQISRRKNAASTSTRPMDPSTVQGCIKSVVDELGFTKKISLHTLRHSIATHLFEAGVSLRWIQKFLGHKNLQTTLIYLHLTDPHEEEGREVLNELAQPGTLFDDMFRPPPTDPPSSPEQKSPRKPR